MAFPFHSAFVDGSSPGFVPGSLTGQPSLNKWPSDRALITVLLSPGRRDHAEPLSTNKLDVALLAKLSKNLQRNQAKLNGSMGH